jgi:hypothetical protein
MFIRLSGLPNPNGEPEEVPPHEARQLAIQFQKIYNHVERKRKGKCGGCRERESTGVVTPE